MDSHNLTYTAGMIGSGTSITSGLFLFFSQNATAIGAMVAVVSAIVTTTFLVLNFMLNYAQWKAKKNYKREVIESLLEKSTPLEREIITKVAEK